MPPKADFLTRLAAGYRDAKCAPETDSILMAVSGGADSMALLRGTADLWPDAGSRMIVAHVDHGLRGKSGKSDADFVRRATDSRGLELVSLTVDVRELRKRQRGTVEEIARRARYEQLTATARQRNCRFVVTAHHRDDQVETILHHVLRGTGLHGLRGMPVIRSLDDSTLLARPMLHIERSVAMSWLEACGGDWRTDETNTSPEFTRNRLRNQVLPFLRESCNPQIDAALLRMSRQIADTSDCLDTLANRALDQSLLEIQPACCRLDANQLSSWPLAVIRQVFPLVWKRVGWPQQPMTFRHWQQLAEAVLLNGPMSASLPAGITLQRRDAVLRLIRE